MAASADKFAEAGLRALIAPIASERFFADYWQRQPLLVQRSDEAYFQHLLSVPDIENYIGRSDARYPAIRLAKGGKFYPPEAYTRDVRYGDETFHGVQDVEQLLTEYNSGASITLPALHRSWQPVSRLCAKLEDELSFPVHTNVYLTPPRAAGFTPHYDTHEVLVLQVGGAKHWRIYPPPLRLPHRTQPFSPEHYSLPSAPLMECVLSPGDTLYLPRGFVHTTTTSEHFSAHLTIGIAVYTWLELFSEMTLQMAEVESFREALPVGFDSDPETHVPMQSRLLELMDAAFRGLNAAALVERFRSRARAAKPRRSARFQLESTLIGAHTRLRVVAGNQIQMTHEREAPILVFNGRRIRLQPPVVPAMSAIQQRGSFTPAELPDNISLDARLTLVRYLSGLGVVETFA